MSFTTLKIQNYFKSRIWNIRIMIIDKLNFWGKGPGGGGGEAGCVF